MSDYFTLWTIQSMEFSRPEYWSEVAFPSPGDLPDPGIEPKSPSLQVDSLPAEPPGKPKNSGVGSLSLLQEIFPTQGWNSGLPHCRWILYQQSHKGSLIILKWGAYPFSSGFSDPGIEPRSPALHADSLPAEPPGKQSNYYFEQASTKNSHLIYTIESWL